MLSNISLKRSGHQLTILVISGAMMLVGQLINSGTPIMESAPGMGIIIATSMVAMLLKDMFPKSLFPAFGFATILGLLLSIPGNAVSDVFNHYVNKVGFMPITTPLLAFAGISVGNKIQELKKMSWKIVVISFVVFTTIFFACATIAHVVLTMQGLI